MSIPPFYPLLRGMVTASAGSHFPPLSRRQLPCDTAELAKYLIGKTLIRASPEGLAGGRIVETEAYLPDDAASHAYRGPTKRNRSMYLRRGHAYVYFIYGTWFALNVSADVPGVGAGVLIRALEPTIGIELMQSRRPRSRVHELAAGPGRLATALAVNFDLDGVDLCASTSLWLAAGPRGLPPPRIGQSIRIGITKDAHRPLRFFEQAHPSLSGPRHLSRRDDTAAHGGPL